MEVLDKLRTTVSKEEATINQHCVAFLDSIVGFEQLQNRAPSPPSRSKEIILFHGADSFGFVSNKKRRRDRNNFWRGCLWTNVVNWRLRSGKFVEHNWLDHRGNHDEVGWIWNDGVG
mmetsp:Transcript_30885/g.65108  ORF Transcript_30885/g.65108 Transcript_30885/m.65108 type:complete len:117 (-) Transcript_30885:91-441(-)